MYLTFDGYTEMGGSIVDGDAFPRFEAMARAELDRHTLGRLIGSEPSETIKRCMVELVEAAALSVMYINPAGGVVTGEGNDGVSKSYATVSASDYLMKVYPRKVSHIIGLYLANETADGVSVLYRGL